MIMLPQQDQLTRIANRLLSFPSGKTGKDKVETLGSTSLRLHGSSQPRNESLQYQFGVCPHNTFCPPAIKWGETTKTQKSKINDFLLKLPKEARILLELDIAGELKSDSTGDSAACAMRHLFSCNFAFEEVVETIAKIREKAVEVIILFDFKNSFLSTHPVTKKNKAHPCIQSYKIAFGAIAKRILIKTKDVAQNEDEAMILSLTHAELTGHPLSPDTLQKLEDCKGVKVWAMTTPEDLCLAYRKLVELKLDTKKTIYFAFDILGTKPIDTTLYDIISASENDENFQQSMNALVSRRVKVEPSSQSRAPRLPKFRT